MSTTQVTWPVPQADFQYQAECRAKAIELGGTAEGTIIQSTPKYIVQRDWADDATANQWISFVLGLGAESAVIIAPL